MKIANKPAYASACLSVCLAVALAPSAAHAAPSGTQPAAAGAGALPTVGHMVAYAADAAASADQPSAKRAPAIAARGAANVASAGGAPAAGAPAASAPAASLRVRSASLATASLESVATKAGETGRKIAISLIGLALAVAAVVLAFRRDFKEAAAIFAVGLVCVLLATSAGESLLQDTVKTLVG